MAESTASEPSQVKKTRASSTGARSASRSASCVGRLVGERVEACCRPASAAHLGGDGVGDLVSAVADVHVPEAGHGVDVLLARRRRRRSAPSPRTIVMKSLAGRAGVGVQEPGNGHAAIHHDPEPAPVRHRWAGAQSRRRRTRPAWARRARPPPRPRPPCGRGPAASGPLERGGDVVGAGRRRVGRARHDQDVLARGASARGPVAGLAQRAPPHLLVQLGQLAADGDGRSAPSTPARSASVRARRWGAS